jgi:hypothetical protein
MVSTKEIDELRRCFEVLGEHSLDLHQFTGELSSVVFEMFTADSFIAGIASKMLDRDPVPNDERIIVSKPLLIEGRWWRQMSGNLFDLKDQPDVLQLALHIERLRSSCNKILSGGH